MGEIFLYIDVIDPIIFQFVQGFTLFKINTLYFKQMSKALILIVKDKKEHVQLHIQQVSRLLRAALCSNSIVNTRTSVCSFKT